jgi:adenine deaminase
MVRDAVAFGIPPEDALVCATLSPSVWHGLSHLGAVAPGYQADLLVLPDLERFVPETVLKAGLPPAEIPHAHVPDWVRHTVRVGAVGPERFRIPWAGGTARVIGIIPGQIVTESLVEPVEPHAGEALADPERDLAKIAVVERHLGTGRIGLGFVRGFGLRRGALASTVAHDAHNIVVVGTNDASMAAAVRRLANIGGGIVVLDGAEVVAELSLPIAGLLSDAPLDQVVEGSRAVTEAARALGCELESPFQHLAFLALSVIPSLKVTDRGLVDVDRFELVPLEAS